MIQTDRDTIGNFLDPALIAEIRRIELRTKRKVDSQLVGNFRSAFRSRGLIFHDLRQYEPGDPVRDIHWKATARTGHTYIKTYQEDRHLELIIAVDQSASTGCGAPNSVSRRALEFTALISILGQSGNDAVGLCLFANEVDLYLPPKTGRSHYLQILYHLMLKRIPTGETDIANAIKSIRAHQRKNSIIFLISDFLSSKYEEDLRLLALKHDVICILAESREADLPPPAGLVSLYDSESGQRFIVDTSSSKVRNAIQIAKQRRTQNLKRLCAEVGADFMLLDDRPLQKLDQLMRTRTSRQR